MGDACTGVPNSLLARDHNEFMATGEPCFPEGVLRARKAMRYLPGFQMIFKAFEGLKMTCLLRTDQNPAQVTFQVGLNSI